MSNHPCLSCGACCAMYRVSFYWAESNEGIPGGVPVELTEKLDQWRLVMKGTNQPHPRCTALVGEIGQSVFCSIYEWRSSVCREFEPSYEHGTGNLRCDQARQVWGLPPLTPEIWFNRPLPRAA